MSISIVNPAASASITTTKWTSFTPTGSFTTNTSYTGFYKRIDDTMEVEVTIAFSGIPNSTALMINTPLSLTIDTSKLPSGSSGFATLGVCYENIPTVNNFGGVVVYDASTANTVSAVVGTGSAALWSNAVPSAMTSGCGMYFRYSIPILEWA